MNPVFDIKGARVVLHPLALVSVALDQWGDAVGSLTQEGQVVSDHAPITCDWKPCRCSVCIGWRTRIGGDGEELPFKSSTGRPLQIAR